MERVSFLFAMERVTTLITAPIFHPYYDKKVPLSIKITDKFCDEIAFYRWS